jgi:hypothetical protein
MSTKKKFILTGLAIWLALASLGGVWESAFAARQAAENSRTVSISSGKPADAWFGQAGVYFSNSAYSGKVILTRPALGTRKSPDARRGKQDLAASHRYLEFKVEDPAWKQVSLLRGLNYVYFNLNSEERVLWNKGDLAIYFFDTGEGEWVECLANHLVSKGDHGRLGCLAAYTGLYVLGETTDD